MATNFNNKYMQVFQNYNEFGEHSADYVRGEDHIAFLIEENEVIYWLYLEQVWRPLNVRTTTTGELEDGRTKVAVRLEYVEGGQKYTSVPNIPDPERITSMRQFLKNYPDIEEVNVSGTVNLTDLSYAFAGSKIKDFSMLDTSKVTTIQGFINNVNNKDLNIDLKIDYISNEIYSENRISLFDINSLTINKTNDEINNKVYVNSCSIVNLKGNVYYVISNATINNIETTNIVYISEGSFYNDIENIKSTDDIYIDIYSFTSNVITNLESNKTIILKSNRYRNDYITNKLIINKANAINLYHKGDYAWRSSFGYGIKNNTNIDFTIDPDTKTIGNFIFTTPIVDDAFYAKYNHPISIFQYKTAFEEVADINLTESTNTSLMYIDWNTVNFDTSKTNVEIYNNVDISGLSGTFNKIIIDNSNLTLNYDEYPLVDDSIKDLKANDGYISGNYVHNHNSSQYIQLNDAILYKDVILWNVHTLMISYCSTTILKDKNIRLRYTDENNVPTIRLDNGDLDINVLAVDNVITFTFHITDITSKLIFDNNITLDITSSSTYGFYINNIVEHLTNENQHTISGEIFISDSKDSYDASDIIKTDSVYLNGKNDLYISNWYSHTYALREYNYIVVYSITNIYGINIGIVLPSYTNGLTKFYMDDETYKHIDISKVMIDGRRECHILCFINSDEETTINLITKLIDNTGNSKYTIYMYRTQANIIGEENIAAAVAKNYEIAIIEN